MAQDLPDDIWIQVAESLRPDHGAAFTMSLAGRRMRRLVVPLLFRNLEFTGYLRQPEESIMVQLIRAIMRARLLFNSPELLRHTRGFSFWEYDGTVDSTADLLALHEGSDSSSSRSDAENFVAVLRDAIFSLIFRMPGLRRLLIIDTVMTPLSYFAISSRPLLTSLSLLGPRLIPDIAHVTPALAHAFRLRDFEYRCDVWTNNGPPDPFLIDILDHCLLDMKKLTMSSHLLPLVVSRFPLHRTLSLQTLSMGVYDGPKSSGTPDVAAFLQVLHACPHLQHVEINGLHPNVELTHYLPPPILPKLSTFSGPSYLLQTLSGGTNLVKIVIKDDPCLEEQSLTQVIRSSPTHLRDLSMRKVIISQTPHELLTFIQSLTLFRNLERVAISYRLDMSWKDHVSSQDSHSTIKDLLNQLACLRFLDIHSSYGTVKGYDIGCPISKQGELADRGHPSLEGIYVDFICGMWSWDSRTGWEMTDRAVAWYI